MSRSSWCFPGRLATSASTVAWHFSRRQHQDVLRLTLRTIASSTSAVTDGSKQLPIRHYFGATSELDEVPGGNERHLVRRVGLPEGPQRTNIAHNSAAANELQSTQTPSRQKPGPLGKNEPQGASRSVRRARTSRTATGSPTNITRATPSQDVLSALELVGCKADIAQPKWWTVDLSYIDPMKAKQQDKTTRHGIDHGKNQTRPRLSYASITADYIRRIYPIIEKTPSGIIDENQDQNNLDEVLLSVFDDRASGPLTYLSERGYSPEDVVTWAWILTSATPLKAAKRLEAIEQWNMKNNSSQRSGVPLFILLLILRQGNIDARALRILISQAWRHLSRINACLQPASTSEPHGAAHSNAMRQRWEPSRDHTSVIILIVRLIRHARAVWPQCLLPVATLATSSLGVSAVTGNSGTLNWQISQHLTFVFNRLLSLLAHPCSIEPYHSVPTQQRAQFHLLREMSRFKPPLAVTREGYQAVTRVQAAHRKTVAEREWAHFKSPSWPPWKEEKLGIDFGRGNEGSRSRSIESINHMRTAGYAPTGWERLAKVYAGWDTDGTPTIQKRVFLPKPSAFRTAPDATTSDSAEFPVRADVKGTNHENDIIWAARIRTTRTLKEAWACFLSYQDQGSGRRHMGVYLAMVEKLVAGKAHEKSPAMPGDGTEVHPEPTSPRDVTYVRTEPPSLDRFLDDMLAEDLKLNGKILSMVLPHASSFKSGLHYISRSTLQERHINALIMHPISQTDRERRQHLSEVRNHIFTAFMRFLGKFSVLDGSPEDGSPVRTAQLFPILMRYHTTSDSESLSPDSRLPDKVQHSKALTHAVQLMQLRNSRHLPAWNRLLWTLSMDRTKSGVPGRPISIIKQRILGWCEIMEVLAWMKRDNIPIDLETLEIVCCALIKVIRSIRRDPDSSERGLIIAARWEKRKFHPIANSLSGLVTEGMRFIKGHFDQLAIHNEPSSITLSEPSDSANAATEIPLALPNLYAVPSPFLLHSLFRLFGLARDQESMLHLLRWISFFADDVRFAAEERAGGMKQLRYAVIAARAFLEGRLDNLGGFVSDPDETNTEDSNEGPDDTKTESITESSDPFIKEARAVVESTEMLAPWPSDEEVRLYIDLGIQNLDGAII